MTPYRNDDEARDMMLDSLKAENAQLVSKCQVLTTENRRLKIIGTELLRSAPIDNQERVVHKLRAELRDFRRTTMLVIAVCCIVLPFIARMMALL